MFESIADYEQRIEIAQKLLQQYTAKYVRPDERFAIAQDIASLVAPGWEWIIRKWEPKAVPGNAPPKVVGRQIQFASNTTLAQLAAILIHKTDHLVMGHQERKGDRDNKLWNVAACLEDIKRWQDIFDRLAIALPAQIDPSTSIKNLPREEAEKLYEMLDPSQAHNAPSDADDQQQAGDAGQPQAGGQQQDKDAQKGEKTPGQGTPSDGQPGEEGPSDGQPGAQAQMKPDGSPQAGDGSGAPTQEQIENAANCELDSDIYDQTMMQPNDGVGQEGEGEGEDGVEGDGEAQGQGKGKGPGKPGDKPGAPGESEGHNRHDLDPRVPYTKIIQLVRRRLNLGKNRMNFSLRRPSNRSEQTGGGVLSRLDHSPDSLRIVVDSSGSLSKPLLNAIFRTVADLEQYARRDGSIDRTVYAHGDTNLRSTPTSNAGKLTTIMSGGGTDMKKVIEDAMKHPKMRDGTAWVIITDGETYRWPDRVPRNTVVILVNNSLVTGQRAPEVFAGNYGYGTYKLPPHIQRVAVCISQRDFIAGGTVQRTAQGREVA